MAQIQFRSDDTSTWIGYGYGTAGDYAPGGDITVTTTPFTGSNNTKTGSFTTTGFTPGPVCIYQGYNTGAWQLNYLLGVSPVTFLFPLTQDYLVDTQIIAMPMYRTFTVGTGITVNLANAWDGALGGVLPIIADTAINVNTSATLSVTGKGYRGGRADDGQGGSHQGWVGEGYNHSWNTIRQQSEYFGSGGGGHGANQGGNGSGGGGGGGAHSTTGANGGGFGSGSGGSGGVSTYGQASLQTMFFGSGGGGNGMDTGLVQVNGLPGGGVLLLIAPTITINGSVFSKGSDSFNSSYANGGAGAGGSINAKCQVLTANNLFVSGGAQSPAGNNPGNPGNWNAYGGAGGLGRIHIDYLTSQTVTNTGGVDARQDNTLKYLPQSSGLFTATW